MGTIDSRSATGGLRRESGRQVSGSWLRADRVCLLLAVVAGFLLRVHRIGSHGLWIDEAFSIWLGRRPLAVMVRWVATVDQHPPFYYALLHGWIRIVGDGEAGARALSVAFGTLTIPVVYLLGRRLVDERVGIVGALILAVSPFHVRFAQEARMYTLLTLNGTLALYAFAGLLDRHAGGLFNVGGRSREGDRRAGDWSGGSSGSWFKPGEGWRRGLPWMGTVVFTAAALWTHNAAVLLSLTLNLFVAVGVLIQERRALRQWRSWSSAPWLRAWVLGQAAILLLWLPWLPSFISQAVGVYRRFWLPAPTVGSVLSVVSVFLCDFLPLPLAGIVVVDGVLVGLALLGLRGLRRRTHGFLLGAAFLVPLAAEWVVSLWRPVLYARTLMWTSVPLILMVAAGVCYVGRVLSSRIGSLLALVVVVAVSGAGLRNYYRTFEKEGWDDAAALVAEHVEPDDLLLFNDSWGQIPFDYYFGELYNRPVVAHGVPADLFDRGVLEPEMTEGDLGRLGTLIRGHERVWLVYSHDWYTDPAGLVPAALEGEMVLRNRWELRGLEVSLYGR